MANEGKIVMFMSLNRILKGGRISQRKRPPLEAAFFVGWTSTAFTFIGKPGKLLSRNFTSATLFS
ncbi:MAG: hypothetical protein WC271_16715 [Bacteroidales bacterium]